MDLSAKKRHHYVSRGYLKYWRTNRGTGKKKSSGVWTFNKDRRDCNFQTSLFSIAQVNYFYNLEVDRDVYDLLRIKYLGKSNFSKEFLKHMKALADISEYQEKKMPGWEKLHVINKNYLEGMFEKMESHISRSLIPIDQGVYFYLKELQEKKVGLGDLLDLFCAQILRTKDARAKVESVLRRAVVVRDGVETFLSERQNRNLIIASMFFDSILLSEDLREVDYSIELLINNSNIPFVTSSCPAIMLGSAEMLSDLRKMEGYMPLNPKVAMIVRGWRPLSVNFTAKSVGLGEAQKWNDMMLNHADYDVYASFDLSNSIKPPMNGDKMWSFDY